MTMVELQCFNLINVYCSSSKSDSNMSFLEDFLSIMDLTKKTLLVGDLNICNAHQQDHPILDLMNQLAFKHNIQNPLYRSGHLIDFASHYCPENSIAKLEVQQFGQFFTDHDMIVVDILELMK